MVDRHRRLKVVLYVVAVGLGLSVFGVVLPWRWLGLWMAVWGLPGVPATPAVVYAVRGCAATLTFTGLFFLLVSQDPVSYRPFLNLGIAGLLLVGLVCLVTGAGVGMHPPWYLIDFLFCWVTGFLLIAWRKPR